MTAQPSIRGAPHLVRNRRTALEGSLLRPSARLSSFSVPPLDQAVEDRILSHNPTARVSAPRIERPDLRIPTTSDVLAIGEQVDVSDRLLINLAAFGGLRFGEAAGIDLGRVDLDRRTITIDQAVREVSGRVSIGPPKTSSARRTVTLPRFMLAEIEQGTRDRIGLLFTDQDGGPLRRTNWRRRVWLPAVNATGCQGVRFHDLRHHAASVLLELGESIPVVAARLGHTSPAVTLAVYSHVLDRGDQQAADRLVDLVDSNRSVSRLAAGARQ